MDREQGRLPPYVSYSTWGRLLEGLEKYLPEVVDSSYFASLAFSGSSARKLRSALRFLGLTSESSVPTEKLKRLVRSLRGEGNESKPDVLGAILHDAYPSMFTGDFSLKRAEAGQLLGRFERMGVLGDLQRQCVSFFLHLAAEVGEELSPDLAGRSRLGIGRKSIVVKSRETKRKATAGRTAEGFHVSASERNLSELDPALIVLLKRLPKSWGEWEPEEKAKFMKAFEALLDVVYPSEVKGEFGDRD